MTVDMLGLIAVAVLITFGTVNTLASGSLDFSQALSDHIAAIETGEYSHSDGAGGNPGNDDPVGGAGEEPNGAENWGSGSDGQSS